MFSGVEIWTGQLRNPPERMCDQYGLDRITLRAYQGVLTQEPEGALTKCVRDRVLLPFGVSHVLGSHTMRRTTLAVADTNQRS
jgi:hypothetical protein